MKREVLMSRYVKAYMSIYHTKLKEEMILQAVDFENETMTLYPFLSSDYMPEPIVANIKDCEFPSKKYPQLTKV